MSDVLYPVAVMGSVRVTPVSRVLVDTFESGATQARAVWSDFNFKRQFVLDHGPMTNDEFLKLRSFYHQRSGMKDTFWFRENFNRGGNAKVRFAAPVPVTKEKMIWHAGIELHEVAPIRANPELDELISASGGVPLVWWDANRIIYFENPGPQSQSVYQEATIFDASKNNQAGTWQQGSTPAPGNILGQWQHFAFTGSEWAKSPTLTLTGTKPAVTLFLFCKSPDDAGSHVAAMIGPSTGAGCAAGIGLEGGDWWRATDGSSFISGGFQNDPDNTWRSIAIGFADSTDSFSFWGNGGPPQSGTFTARNYSAQGPLTLGATISGGSKMGNTSALAQVIAWNYKLSDAQVTAVHNLLKYQFGL